MIKKHYFLRTLEVLILNQKKKRRKWVMQLVPSFENPKICFLLKLFFSRSFCDMLSLEE